MTRFELKLRALPADAEREPLVGALRDGPLRQRACADARASVSALDPLIDS